MSLSVFRPMSLRFCLAASLCSGPLGCARLWSQTCTTQSQMQPADRDALAAAARHFAAEVQSGDQAGVKALTIDEYAKDFSGIAGTIATAAPALKSTTESLDQVYLLDASTMKRGADGSALDTQFFCTLNRTAMEADFSIPALPPGRYGFAIVHFEGAAPWAVSLLLRQDAGKWLLAGLYAKPQLAAGHNGLWYWTEARALAQRKQPWNAFLYYQEAQALLQPAAFVSSTHLEKLRTESVTAAPPALSSGIGTDTPLIVKAADGTEYRITALAVDTSLESAKPDVAAHLKVDQLGDAATARKRNLAAMSALLGAYPELRQTFHGVWIFTDAPGQNPVANEAAMAEIH